MGVGIDVVDVGRFTRQLERTPRLRERLFTPTERELPPASLAARFAAKEALAKALGAPVGLRWTTSRSAAARRPAGPGGDRHGGGPRGRTGGGRFHLSLSHDAGIASAVVIAEGRPPPPPARGPRVVRPGFAPTPAGTAPVGGPTPAAGRVRAGGRSCGRRHPRGRGRADGHLPAGALMQRAATALSVACARHAARARRRRLRAPRGAAGGAGDNGGDALWAGAAAGGARRAGGRRAHRDERARGGAVRAAQPPAGGSSTPAATAAPRRRRP